MLTHMLQLGVLTCTERESTVALSGLRREFFRPTFFSVSLVRFRPVAFHPSCLSPRFSRLSLKKLCVLARLHPSPPSSAVAQYHSPEAILSSSAVQHGRHRWLCEQASQGAKSNRLEQSTRPCLPFTRNVSSPAFFFCTLLSSLKQSKTIVIKFPAIKSRAFHLIKVRFVCVFLPNLDHTR